MRRTLSSIMVLTLCSAPGFAQSIQNPVAAIQRSHIDANVPATQDFRTLMQRDLLDYARASIADSATSVEYELLREQPTQSGVAYPKYYAWIKVRAGSEVLREGAVRVAAIERKRFDVTDFVSSEQIRSSSDRIDRTFPASLVATILARAAP